MNLYPSESLTENQVKKGLKLVVADGLASEAMVTFTGGAFLAAIALHLGATNFQLGVLAALPAFSSVFQLFSIWLVRRSNNRRAIAVISNIFARFPLLLIGILPLAFSAGTSVQVLIFTLFFHYFFGSVAGASWNSWMKDLVPEKQLGTYFSYRSRLSQILNVTLSLLTAVILDYIKIHYPAQEITAYALMFLTGGVLGMIGVYALAKTPEPRSVLANENLFRLFNKPIKDKNFKSLLVFHSFWAFSLNLATPFFSVYMLKTIGLPLSHIIGLSILTQISSIAAIRILGKYADKYSNKTIIQLCAPVYVICIMAWTLAGMPSDRLISLIILAAIHIFSGISTAGINIALNNIGLKLASKNEAIVYLTFKNMVVAACTAAAPLIGGLMADFFASHQFNWKVEWEGANGTAVLHILQLKGWSFFFMIGGLLAALSLKLLNRVHEQGEIRKERAVIYMRANFRAQIRRIQSRSLFSKVLSPILIPALKRRKPIFVK